MSDSPGDDRNEPDPNAPRPDKDLGLWRGLVQIGTLGWVMVTPPVLGAFLGHLLDMRLHTGIQFALLFLMLGLLAGAYMYWRVVRKETTPPRE